MKKNLSLSPDPFIISFIISLLIVLFSTFAYASTPIANYQMDECSWNGVFNEVKDSSGNNLDGTAMNGADTELSSDAGGGLCHVGKFIKNNSQYVAIDDDTKLNPNDNNWSISVWVKWDGGNSEQIIYNKENLYEAKLQNGKFYYAWQPYWYWVGGISLNQGEWTHFVVTYDHAEQKVYKNGSLVYSRSQTGDIGSNSSKLLIGARGDTNPHNYFNGDIDELTIFKGSLAANQVQDIYNNEKAHKNYDGSERVCQSCPVANYRMDECKWWSGISGEVKDSSGNGYDLTPENGANTVLGGELCKSGDFSSNKRVKGTWHQIFHDKVTLIAWIKTSKKQQPYARVVEFSDSSGDYHYSTALAFDNTGKIIRGWTTGTLGRSTEVNYNLKTNGYFDNKWHQIVFVYDGSKAKLYVDKDLKDSKNTNIDDIVDGKTMAIGGYYSGTSYYFTGQIDEVKIFDNALNDLNINNIYDNEKAHKNWDGRERICPSCILPPVTANYQMDECSWNGVFNEVKDSSGNNLDGTAMNGADTELSSDAGGGLCHVGKFIKNNSQYVAIDDDTKLNPNDNNWSISVWVKWDGGNSEQIIYNKENLYEAKLQNGKFYYAWQPYWYWVGGISLNQGEWTHFVVTYDHAEQKVYKNGSLVYSRSQTGDIGSNSSKLLIGARGDTNPHNYFNGDIDELTIFKGSLAANQVQDIYNNEKAHKNYDGSERVCQSCKCKINEGNTTITPLEFEGAHIVLKNTYEGAPFWTHVDFNKTFVTKPVVFIVADDNGTNPASVKIKNVTKSGFDAVMVEPQGEDGPHYSQHISFLAVNKGIHKIGNTYFQVGSIDTKKYQQANRGVIAHSEWEKISTIFSSCTPVVVANIQSLNNEIGLDVPNHNKIIRSKPWLTTAIDVNDSGVYLSLERSETDEGSISKDETVGYMIAPANIQDSVVDDNGNNILFETIQKVNYFRGWDGVCKKVNFVNAYNKTPLIAANKNSKNEMDGGWFRRCKLSKTEVGFVIDEDGGSSSRTNYNYKSPPQDREREHSPETGGIFVFSDTIIIHENPENKNYKFDAWDTFRSISDRNISTKIVNKDFDLNIASLNETGDNYQDFNGTVCVQVGNSIKKLLFNDINITTTTLKIQEALKDTKVKISWKKNVDENCPLNNEDNSTLSSDNFAIRPGRFTLSFQPPFYAGDDFNITFQALDGDDKNTTDYNETKDMSFVIESNITKAGCYQGSLSVNNFSFQNGKAKDVNASYSNIGDINITIKEKAGSEFAYVDRDDTNDTVRLITPATTTITVKPYDINVTNVTYQNSTGKTWLYDANVSDMNVTVSATIKAFAKNATTPLPDFNATCYAKDVNVSFLYDANYTDTNVSLDATPLEGILSYQDINNSSVLIPSSNFIGGEANASYAFNVKRVYNKPLNPVKIQLKDINITTTDISKNQNSALQTGNVNSAQNSTFYYGKTYMQDIETTEQNSSSSFFIDVYCNACQYTVSSFFQESLNWYRNELDSSVTKKTDITVLPKEGFTLSSPDKNNITVSNITDANNAKISFDITNSKNSYDTAVLHVKIPRWLWYNDYKDYNDSNSSDCSTHPCIGYKLLTNTKSSIKSGVFKGSDIGHEQNRTIKKVGVKVYR